MIPLIPLVAGIGSLIGGVGGFLQGQQNKRVYRAQAREELRSNNEQQRVQRAEARRAIGAQFAAQGSNGMVPGVGTAAEAIRESLLDQVLDTRELRRQGVSRAKSLRASGRMAETSGYFSLASGLFGAASAYKGAEHDWAQARSDSYG